MWTTSLGAKSHLLRFSAGLFVALPASAWDFWEAFAAEYSTFQIKHSPWRFWVI